jgi:hypothetical protein
MAPLGLEPARLAYPAAAFFRPQIVSGFKKRTNCKPTKSIKKDDRAHQNGAVWLRWDSNPHVWPIRPRRFFARPIHLTQTTNLV